MLKQKLRRSSLAAVLLICGLATGCDPGDGPIRAAVSGEVTIDGQPLPRGSIEFIPTAGTRGPKAAAEIVNGKYQLPRRRGPVVGTLRIEINSLEPLFAVDDPREFSKNEAATIERNLIPPQYNQYSTLTRTITVDGPNEFDFAIHTGE